MNTKLGIKDKGEPMTPEKLAKYIENLKVPVGDILKGLHDLIRSRTQEPMEGPPPPRTAPPNEAEIVSRAVPELRSAPGLLPRGVAQNPREMTTQETLGVPPSEAQLPPEAEPPPPPEAGSPPKTKKIGGKKKSAK